ncbi:MAG: hypothetical protein ACM3TR_08790 [Caulobacteraceae bacterium]
MSFLKNLQEKAASTAQVIGSKSQEMVEVGKLKLHITQVEGEIKKYKLEIGEAVYNAYSKGEDFPSEAVEKLLGDLTAKYTEIENTKVKIQEAQAKSGQAE